MPKIHYEKNDISVKKKKKKEQKQKVADDADKQGHHGFTFNKSM